MGAVRGLAQRTMGCKPTLEPAKIAAIPVDRAAPRASVTVPRCAFDSSARMRKVRKLAAALALVTGLYGLNAAADDHPTPPVKIVVPFGAGGPTDVFTRAMANELRKILNQPFVMENRPGAGLVIGIEAVGKSAPDGYTLLMISATQAVNETLIARKPYRLDKDFVAIAPLMRTNLVLVVHPSVPAANLAELIALAKAKPGTLNYGSSGIGSNYHMAAELFKSSPAYVPYKGSTGAHSIRCPPWRRSFNPA